MRARTHGSKQKQKPRRNHSGNPETTAAQGSRTLFPRPTPRSAPPRAPAPPLLLVDQELDDAAEHRPRVAADVATPPEVEGGMFLFSSAFLVWAVRARGSGPLVRSTEWSTAKRQEGQISAVAHDLCNIFQNCL